MVEWIDNVIGYTIIYVMSPHSELLGPTPKQTSAAEGRQASLAARAVDRAQALQRTSNEPRFDRAVLTGRSALNKPGMRARAEQITEDARHTTELQAQARQQVRDWNARAERVDEMNALTSAGARQVVWEKSQNNFVKQELDGRTIARAKQLILSRFKNDEQMSNPLENAQLVTVQKQLETDVRIIIEQAQSKLGDALWAVPILLIFVLQHLPIRPQYKRLAVTMVFTLIFGMVNAACARQEVPPPVPTQAVATEVVGLPSPIVEVKPTTAVTEAATDSEAANRAAIQDYLVTQITNACREDVARCQAFEAYEESLQEQQPINPPTPEPQPTATIPVGGGEPIYSRSIVEFAEWLAARGIIWRGLLQTAKEAGVEEPLTGHIDKVTGRPAIQLNIDAGYGEAGTWLVPSVDGSQDVLVASPQGAERQLGAPVTRLDIDGPGVVNAYNATGELIGIVSADTGTWIKADQIKPTDIKQAIVEVSLEELAKQVVEGKTTLAEATVNMSVQDRLEFSGKVIEVLDGKRDKKIAVWAERGKENQPPPQWRALSLGSVDDLNQHEQTYRWGDGSKVQYVWKTVEGENQATDIIPGFYIKAAKDQDGNIVYEGADGERIIFTGQFLSESEMREIIQKEISEAGRWSNFENDVAAPVGGLLYRVAEKAIVVGNVDPAYYPKPIISIAVPVYVNGELVALRECFVQLSLSTSFFDKGKWNKITMRGQNEQFFGRKDEADLGKLIYLHVVDIITDPYKPSAEMPTSYNTAKNIGTWAAYLPILMTETDVVVIPK